MERGTGCNGTVIGTPGVIQVTNRNGTGRTGTSAMPACHYADCYVIASNALGTVCSLVAPNIITLITQNFDTFNLGSIKNQQGWNPGMYAGFDQAITQVIKEEEEGDGGRWAGQLTARCVAAPPPVLTCMPTPAPFFSSQVGANRVWRISNANSTVGFGDQPWTPSTSKWAGETGAASFGTPNVTATTNNTCFAVRLKGGGGGKRGKGHGPTHAHARPQNPPTHTTLSLSSSSGPPQPAPSKTCTWT